jgi:hypothetical protein
MEEDRRQVAEDDLVAVLKEFVDQLGGVSDTTRARAWEMALELHARRLPPPFIFAGIRSTAEILTELEQTMTPDEARRQRELRAFVAANTPVQGSVAEIDTRKDVKSGERERLRQSIISAVRDARRSKARHEIKKTRNVLMKIDQRHVRRTLGREGDELCHEINRILRATAAMF